MFVFFIFLLVFLPVQFTLVVALMGTEQVVQFIKDVLKMF